MPRVRLFIPFAFTLLAASPALAQPLTLATVFFDAAETMKALMLGLVLAALAGAILTAAKLASGRRLSGGSAYLSGLRWGGPLIGLLGASFVLLSMFIGIANAPVSPPLRVLAPGFAEAALLVMLGILAGAVGVIGNWAVEARIDRAVLKA